MLPAPSGGNFVSGVVFYSQTWSPSCLFGRNGRLFSFFPDIFRTFSEHFPDIFWTFSGSFFEAFLGSFFWTPGPSSTTLCLIWFFTWSNQAILSYSLFPVGSIFPGILFQAITCSMFPGSILPGDTLPDNTFGKQFTNVVKS